MTTPFVHSGAERAPSAAGLQVLELANADLVGSCIWAPRAIEAGTTPLPIYPQKEHSLARANGRDWPVSARGAHDPKTPAAGRRGCHVVAASKDAGDDTAPQALPRPAGGGVR